MPRTRILRQLLAASAVLLLVASVTYVLGRAFMPAFTSAIADIAASIPTTAPAFDPQEVIDDIPQPAAAVVITGAVEEQLVLDRVTFRPADIGNRPDLSSKDIDIRYEGGASTLLLRATNITVGEPRTSSMTMILTTSGLSFVAQPGDCVLVVHHFEYVPAPRNPPPALAPTFAGELECTVAELRSGAIATFVIAFDR
jgi:hypothetical protein